MFFFSVTAPSSSIASEFLIQKIDEWQAVCIFLIGRTAVKNRFRCANGLL